jgi:LmbE family N-acetylglucosaminyl deacetylase
MKNVCLLVSFCVLTLLSFSQNNTTSADIYLGLKKLNVLGSVLYVAAHPDDENTRLLTYLAKDRLYRTGYLSLTRGDGGQNLIGDEQGIELGLIRTQELLAARRIDGAEQYFTRAYDFGYSKTPEETFTKWDREKILSDVVWVIRKLQPDVIITRFPTTGEGGHGHHTASAILANEAFRAAADPKRFPGQLKFVSVWQAKRILWNAFNFGSVNTTREDQFKFDVGGYNPLLGKSYGEIAADSRSQHKSQGFGVPRTRGEALEYFKTTGGEGPRQDLFENVVTDWSKVKGSEKVAALIASATAGFDFLQPERSVPRLVEIYKALQALPAGYWKDQKLKETKELIETASGLWVDAFTNEAYVAQTDSVRMIFSLNNRSGLDIKLVSVSADGFDTTFNNTLGRNQNFNFSRAFLIPESKPVTQPYWLENKMSEGYFNVSDQKLIGTADVHPSYVARFDLVIEGEQFVIEKPVRYKFTDPVKGELYQPFVVVPPFTVSTPKQITALREGLKEWRQEFIYTAQKKLNQTRIYEGDHLLVDDKESKQKGNSKSFSALFDLKTNTSSLKTVKDTFSFRYYQHPLSQPARNMHFIRYAHIPDIYYFTNAENAYSLIDVKTAGKKIGYIIGAGDKVPEALELIGYEVTLLTDKELSRNNLQQFDAIISGVRAYNTNEWLNRHYAKLMRYVEDGGNMIVQYNTSNNIGPVRARIGPYDFNITRTRITDENAPVVFLKPGHPVLNYPNKITQDDFKGWVQERSIYHAAGFDPSFETILSMNDPNESAEAGSLIISKYGKGFFTYTGLVFFRELPAGVPGAYRLMANLIALNRKKEF